MYLNDNKTEFLIIGTRQQLSKVTLDGIQVGQSIVSPVSLARSLGAWFDANMSMKTRVSKVCGSAFYYLHNIKRIINFLSKECTETLIHAFVSNRLYYCNSLFLWLTQH